MPGDFKDRDAYERSLARVLGRINAQTRRDVLKLLGEPPSLEKLTPDIWEVIAHNYMGAIDPVLESVFVAAVEQWMSSGGIGVAVSWDMANQRAIDWAYQYTFELVEGMNRTAQRRLAQAIEHHYQGRIDLEGVKQRINALFGAQRASTIAITEVTRAAVQGQKWYEMELNGMGIRTVRVWQTANDELVCPICGPNNGKTEDEGWTVAEPPAHPNCRCWIAIEPVLPDGSRA